MAATVKNWQLEKDHALVSLVSNLLNPPTTPTTPKVELTQLQQATLHVMQLKQLHVPIGSTWRAGSSTWTMQTLTPKNEEKNEEAA